MQSAVPDCMCWVLFQEFRLSRRRKMPKDEWKSTKDQRAMRRPKRRQPSAFDNWQSIDDINKMLEKIEQDKQKRKEQSRQHRIAKGKAKAEKRGFRKSTKTIKGFDRKNWSPSCGCSRRGCDSNRFVASHSHGDLYRISCAECGNYIKFINPQHAGDWISQGIIEQSEPQVPVG